MDCLTAISSIDGRYYKKIKNLVIPFLNLDIKNTDFL